MTSDRTWTVDGETFADLRESSDALTDSAELQRRIADDGYVFFRGLLPREKLEPLRVLMLQEMQRGGWIAPGTNPVDGIATPGVQCTEGDPEYTDVYHKVYEIPEFHRIAHEPAVTQVVERLLGGPIVPQPQKICRLWFPQYTDHTTPIHQDFVHFQGSTKNLTAWTPVGPCPIELGPLAVLQQSHKVNRVVDHHFALGAGSLAIDIERLDLDRARWHTTSFGWGDTLIFSAVMIHRALPNYTADRLRVSLDNRYQLVSDQIAHHMTQPHLQSMNPVAWKDIYQGWDPADPLQYYWEKMPMTVIPRDETFSNKGFEDAIRLARDGDSGAIHHLRRFVRRDPESPQSRAALKVLEESQ